MAASLACWVIYFDVFCVHEGSLHELVVESLSSYPFALEILRNLLCPWEERAPLHVH